MTSLTGKMSRSLGNLHQLACSSIDSDCLLLLKNSRMTLMSHLSSSRRRMSCFNATVWRGPRRSSDCCPYIPCWLALWCLCRLSQDARSLCLDSYRHSCFHLQTFYFAWIFQNKCNCFRVSFKCFHRRDPPATSPCQDDFRSFEHQIFDMQDT